MSPRSTVVVPPCQSSLSHTNSSPSHTNSSSSRTNPTLLHTTHSLSHTSPTLPHTSSKSIQCSSLSQFMPFTNVFTKISKICTIRHVDSYKHDLKCENPIRLVCCKTFNSLPGLTISKVTHKYNIISSHNTHYDSNNQRVHPQKVLPPHTE